MQSNQQINYHRVCIAPMMDWTDRHCRIFHRQLTRHALLYTEMVTTGALVHGDVPRHLDFSAAERPVALQLGGSEPDDLARCARLGERWGYDEINLNCGCPSERVQRGAFGACLMAEPNLVADCVKAMRDTVSIPVTVKHRIGIDRNEDYGFMRDFVGTLAEAGCGVFIVHARNAWLKGLSPKENREVPPLRYEMVFKLKQEFPALTIVLNGGLVTAEAIDEILRHVDGVMLGREAYHNPYFLAQADRRWYGDDHPMPTRREIVERMIVYAEEQLVKDNSSADSPNVSHRHVELRGIVRHMLGLYHGQPRARLWRRMLSDANLLKDADASLLRNALEEVEGRGGEELAA